LYSFVSFALSAMQLWIWSWSMRRWYVHQTTKPFCCSMTTINGSQSIHKPPVYLKKRDIRYEVKKLLIPTTRTTK
jgi:hypothetical protein